MSGYLLTFGETMALMSTEKTGPLAHSATMSVGIGGSESNVAIGARRLGSDVVWCGRVGSDPLGQLVQREIAAEGVDARVVVDPTAATGLMIKERRTTLSQRVMYYRAGSAGSRLCAADVPNGLVEAAAVLHVSGITPALSPSAAQTVSHCVAVARAAGVTVSFDLKYRSNLWSAERAREAYRELIPLADVVFAGDDEAEIAVGPSDDPELLARRIVDLGAGSAVIKLGAKGAVALVGNELYRQPAVPIAAIDTVGAGDAFVAGYLSELIRGVSVADRLATATVAGAFVCLVPGDWEGLPRRSELHLLTAKEAVTR